MLPRESELHEAELPLAQSQAIAHAVREALARRRISRQMLADEARISISTLEKALSGRRPFTLATTVRLEEALGIALRSPASPSSPPAKPGPRHAPDELGSYTHEAVTFLEGRYLTLRPSFGAPDAIFAYQTEILWDEEQGRLLFREAERLDAPFSQTGEVSVPSQSGQIHLVTNFHGQHRIAMLGRPTITGEMFGILTTLFSGRGNQLIPAATPLALVPERGFAAGSVQFGRITADMESMGAYRRILARVRDDGFAVFPGCEPGR